MGSFAVFLVYLVLNIIFLAGEGLTNEGRPRIPLFLFVLVTLSLTGGGKGRKGESGGSL